VLQSDDRVVCIEQHETCQDGGCVAFTDALEVCRSREHYRRTAVMPLAPAERGQPVQADERHVEGRASAAFTDLGRDRRTRRRPRGTLAASVVIAIVYAAMLAAEGLAPKQIQATSTANDTGSDYFLVNAVVGIVFSLLGGYVCARTVRRNELRVTAILALLVLGTRVFHGSRWHRSGALGGPTARDVRGRAIRRGDRPPPQSRQRARSRPCERGVITGCLTPTVKVPKIGARTALATTASAVETHDHNRRPQWASSFEQ
jgi:hypothetical protein